MVDGNINKKRTFVHLANKRRVEEQDLMRKNRIIRLLRENFNLIAVGLIPNVYMRDRETNKATVNTNFISDMNRSAIFQKYEINLPDLYIKGKPPRIIELDGSIHGLYDKITESDQTRDRNENYKLGGYKEDDGTLIIITAEDEKLDDCNLVVKLASKLKLEI